MPGTYTLVSGCHGPAPGHDSYWRFHREAFLPLVPPQGRLTLDIGCGEGRLTRDLSWLGHRVLGIDASPAMVAAAACVPGAAGRVAAGDAAALPVAGAAADCAVAFMSLQDIDHMEQAVAEAARVLVPGGRLVIAVTHPAEALADAGFLMERIRQVGDPSPADKWHKIPLFLHIRALRSSSAASAVLARECPARHRLGSSRRRVRSNVCTEGSGLQGAKRALNRRCACWAALGVPASGLVLTVTTKTGRLWNAPAVYRALDRHPVDGGG
jgi:ubiquinone/menaquinone biosynthesis C-methylase UbiE